MMDIPASNSRFTVEHTRVTSDRSFEDVAAALVRQLVPFDLAGLLVELAAGGDAEAIRARLEALVSPSGLMLFGERDHGLLLRLAGQQRKAVQYDVGNPLF